MQHVMIDLETWGTKPGAMLRSIGAVTFDPNSGTLGSTFYANIADAGQEVIGLHKDPSTVEWWAEQSAEAQAALTENQQPLADVLVDFTQWWEDVRGVFVWGHGASFDPVLLEAAYAACGKKAPWSFWNVRCCRTVLALSNRRPARNVDDVHHNALHDAQAQARAVAASFRSGMFTPD